MPVELFFVFGLRRMRLCQRHFTESFHRVIKSESRQDWRLGESGYREVVVSVTEQAESRFQQVEKPRGHGVKERVRERESASLRGSHGAAEHTESRSISKSWELEQEGVRSPEI